MTHYLFDKYYNILFMFGSTYLANNILLTYDLTIIEKIFIKCFKNIDFEILKSHRYETDTLIKKFEILKISPT